MYTICTSCFRHAKSNIGRFLYCTFTSLCKHSYVFNSINPFDNNFAQVRWTCSIQGENEQSFPPDFFKVNNAWSIANHGCGRSKKIASTLFSNCSPKPSTQTSLWFEVTNSPRPCLSNSVLATFTRCSWKSNVWRWPWGRTARISAWESDPLPVPKPIKYQNKG